MKKTRNLAFIVELLLLFVILLFVIVVITRTLMQSRSQSDRARHLTEAVCLAEEVAEVTAAAGDKAAAAELLGGLEQVQSVAESPDGIDLDMTFAGGVRDDYHIAVGWDEEPSAAGKYVKRTVLVFYGGAEEPVYRLEAGNYVR